MMTLEQFYLIKIAEEATELAQAALKASQFGLFEMIEGTHETNEGRMTKEYNDLLGVMSMLRYKGYEYPVLMEDYGLQNEKMNKVEKYLTYSQSLGLVEKD